MEPEFSTPFRRQINFLLFTRLIKVKHNVRVSEEEFDFISCLIIIASWCFHPLRRVTLAKNCCQVSAADISVINVSTMKNNFKQLFSRFSSEVCRLLQILEMLIGVKFAVKTFVSRKSRDL